MQTELLSLELEPEDVELLAKVAQETGKPFSLLVLEAIRATYGSRTDTTAAQLLDAITIIRDHTSKLCAAIEEQQKILAYYQGEGQAQSPNLLLSQALLNEFNACPHQATHCGISTLKSKQPPLLYFTRGYTHFNQSLLVGLYHRQ
jgi:hypothetical protein